MLDTPYPYTPEVPHINEGSVLLIDANGVLVKKPSLVEGLGLIRDLVVNYGISPWNALRIKQFVYETPPASLAKLGLCEETSVWDNAAYLLSGGKRSHASRKKTGINGEELKSLVLAGLGVNEQVIQRLKYLKGATGCNILILSDMAADGEDIFRKIGLLDNGLFTDADCIFSGQVGRLKSSTRFWSRGYLPNDAAYNFSAVTEQNGKKQRLTGLDERVVYERMKHILFPVTVFDLLRRKLGRDILPRDCILIDDKAINCYPAANLGVKTFLVDSHNTLSTIDLLIAGCI